MIGPTNETEVDLLSPHGIIEFKTRVAIAQNDIITQSENFTNTLEFLASNVVFNDSQLITELEPDSDIVAYTCNYGKKCYHGYVMDAKKASSAAKRKSTRKLQGTGDEFNSQITFVVRSRSVKLGEDGVMPKDAKVYKFKVFQNGKIQLPGAKDVTIEDAMSCADIVLQSINGALHAGDGIVSAFTRARAVMRNYKFQIKFDQPNQIINLNELSRLLRADRVDQQTLQGANRIMEVKKADKTPVSILFASSCPNLRHGGRVVIYLRGKVNILGGKMYCDADNIGLYLSELFRRNRDTLIVEADD